jgi:hypothetical protein
VTTGDGDAFRASVQRLMGGAGDEVERFQIH